MTEIFLLVPDIVSAQLVSSYVLDLLLFSIYLIAQTMQNSFSIKFQINSKTYTKFYSFNRGFDLLQVNFGAANQSVRDDFIEFNSEIKTDMTCCVSNNGRIWLREQPKNKDQIILDWSELLFCSKHVHRALVSENRNHVQIILLVLASSH